MGERVQIGVEVDAEVWQRYREWVDSKHGKTRGVLGDEVENALRQQIGEEITPGIGRLEKRLARIENEIGAAATDGGAATDDDAAYTHAPSRLNIDEKPPANAATEKKVAYLAECILDQEVPETRSLTSIPRKSLTGVVKDEYGFRSDTAKRYVEQLVEHFDLREHPDNDMILVSQAKYDNLIEQRREQLRADAEEEQ